MSTRSGSVASVLPARSLPLDEVLGLLVLKLHLFAHLLVADAEGFLVNLEGNVVADVVDFERGAVLDRSLDAVVAEVSLLNAVLFRPEVAMRVLSSSGRSACR